MILPGLEVKLINECWKRQDRVVKKKNEEGKRGFFISHGYRRAAATQPKNNIVHTEAVLKASQENETSICGLFPSSNPFLSSIHKGTNVIEIFTSLFFHNSLSIHDSILYFFPSFFLLPTIDWNSNSLSTHRHRHNQKVFNQTPSIHFLLQTRGGSKERF